MSTHEIRAHALEVANLDEELEDCEDLLPVALEHLAKVPDNLGAGFDDALKILGLRRALGGPDDQLVDALRLVCDLGVALLQRSGQR